MQFLLMCCVFFIHVFSFDLIVEVKCVGVNNNEFGLVKFLKIASSKKNCSSCK